MKYILLGLSTLAFGISTVAFADVVSSEPAASLHTSGKQLKIEVLKPLDLPGGAYEGAIYRASQTVFIQFGKPYRDDLAGVMEAAGFDRTAPYCSLTFVTQDFFKPNVDRELPQGTIYRLDLNQIVESFDDKEQHRVSLARFLNPEKNLKDSELKGAMCVGSDLTTDTLQNQLNWAFGFKKVRVSVE